MFLIIRIMKYVISIITIMLSIEVFAQFVYIDQTELYVELDIKEVNSFDNDSGINVNDERWLVDEKGRIISNELLPIYDDSAFSKQLYFYENDKHIKTVHIKFRYLSALTSNKVDTSVTTYFFNEKDQVTKSIYTSTRKTDTSVSVYENDEDKFIRKVMYDRNNRVTAIDSVLYYKNGRPHIESRIYFNHYFSISDESKISGKVNSYFDITGLINLVLKLQFNNDGHFIPVESESFVYQNGKLIRTITIDLGTEIIYDSVWDENLRKTETYFYYDERGLVIKEEEYRDGKSEPHYVQTYEYK